MKRSIIAFIFLCMISTTLPAQETPFLNYDERMMLINELSGDRSFEHIRILSQWHRGSGMDGYFKAADYVVEQAEIAGLVDVKFVEQALEDDNYTAINAELWITDPVEYKLADIGDHALFLSDGSYSTNIESAELVYIGDGSIQALENVDVKGKIVLTNKTPQEALSNAVYEKGALGVVCYPSSESRSPLDFPDQLAWTRISMKIPDGKEGSFSFNISPRKGEMLREMLQSDKEKDFFRIGKKVKGGKITVKANVQTKFSKQKRTGFVEGWIRGTKHNDQQIVITAHLQEEQGSANDDGSGCANLLEIGRTLNKLIAEGKIDRPLRDIRFWWTDEIYSEYQYFSNNPGEPKKMLANLHQDMVGAKMSIGDRTQHLIYAPHSITTYLDALFESIGNYVIYSNNPFITAGRMGGFSRPHSVGIYSNRGSREGFRARFVPFFNASDNINFVEGIIGVPAVALINWDDYYIHSSDDDLWQIDQTQLKRNAFIITSMAYFLGKATQRDVPLLLSETYTQGVARLANDLKSAFNEISTLDDAEQAYKNAHLVIEQGVQREIQAINSIRIFSEKNTSHIAYYENRVKSLWKLEENMFADLKLNYSLQFGKSAPSIIMMSEEELAAQKKVPINNTNLRDYFENRKKVKYKGKLHSTMRFETYNFVDGKRSYYDIYKAVKAENLAATRFFYGEVQLEDVVNLLDEAVEKEALMLN